MDGPELRARDLVLRPVAQSDVPVLASILIEPDVARWWPSFDADRVRADFIEDDDVTTWAIDVADAPRWRNVGLIQCWEEADVEFRHASIDLFLSTDAQGHQLGPRAVRLVARWLVGQRGHHRLTIDPAAANTRAIRAYGKVGFQPVGRMRQYQRMADGHFADALLMELLADELAPTITVDALAEQIANRAALSGRPVLVAVDGRSGSGKSTAADGLASRLDAVVVRGDDFYRDLSDETRRALPPAQAAELMFDVERLRSEALAPLLAGEPGTYHPHDWVTGTGLASTVVSLDPRPIVILDGVYAGRAELSDLVDVAVCLEADEATRLQRLAERGHGNEQWHSVWEAAEDYHFTHLRPPAAFDFRIA
jgi:aminoglycoside 6'-N-acetyltransferase